MQWVLSPKYVFSFFGQILKSLWSLQYLSFLSPSPTGTNHSLSFPSAFPTCTPFRPMQFPFTAVFFHLTSDFLPLFLCTRNSLNHSCSPWLILVASPRLSLYFPSLRNVSCIYSGILNLWGRTYDIVCFLVSDVSTTARNL